MDEGDVSKKQDDEQQADVVSVDALMAPAENGGEDGTPETMETSGLVAIVEALVFASPEPITQKQLFKLLDTEPKEEVQAALQELARRYERSGGLQLVEVAGGYQIVTRPELHEWVRRLFHERTTQKLSVQSLETLAVIAYKQPVTAMEIAEIRGVNTSGVIGTLLERGLVKISGRKQVVGRPFLYSTTREFLDSIRTEGSGGSPEGRRHGRCARLRAARRTRRPGGTARRAGHLGGSGDPDGDERRGPGVRTDLQVRHGGAEAPPYK